MNINISELRVVNALCSTMSRIVALVLLAVVGLVGQVALAQQKPNVVGNYVGTLGPLHLKLHLAMTADDALSGTLDSPDQGASGLACSDFHFDGTALSFTVPSVHGTWKGVVASDGASLSGTWDQGSPM